METGAPATDKGQQRRITVMIVLVLALVVVGVVYGFVDPKRASDAEERQLETTAERGATLFANNCASCHGINGEGLIGPPLNKQENRPEDSSTRVQLFDLFTKTIRCGRVGTVMPSWGQSEGGPLNEQQILQLATLITTDPRAIDSDADPQKFWLAAEEHWKEINPELEEPLIPTGLVPNPGACGQKLPGTPTPTGSPTTAPTGTATPAATGTPAVSNEITIVATDNRFDLTTVEVAAGQQVKLTLKNQGAVLHNWHLKGPEVVTDFLPGGQEATLEFAAPSPGSYEFLCDIHPAEMKGTLTVK